MHVYVYIVHVYVYVEGRNDMDEWMNGWMGWDGMGWDGME